MSGPRILVVDDESQILRALRTSLRGAGYEVEVAATAEEALATAAMHPPNGVKKIAALDAGADDYVTKPFGIEELLARLRAALRRVEAPTAPVFELGELVVDLERRLVTVRGEPVSLTPTEFELLRLFVRNEGKLLTHATILREVWGPAYGAESHYLHVYVSQLRRKIEPDPARPRILLTEPGAGYRLVRPS